MTMAALGGMGVMRLASCACSVPSARFSLGGTREVE